LAAKAVAFFNPDTVGSSGVFLATEAGGSSGAFFNAGFVVGALTSSVLGANFYLVSSNSFGAL